MPRMPQETQARSLQLKCRILCVARGIETNLHQDRTILLVEDSSDDERLTLRAIRTTDPNIQVIVARDGEEALGLLFGVDGKGPIRPALVLLDLKLPKVGGLEVLRRLREQTST